VGSKGKAAGDHPISVVEAKLIHEEGCIGIIENGIVIAIILLFA